jgi:hypothetical protein
MAMASRCWASVAAAMLARLSAASVLPLLNAATSSSDGCATKSLAAICMRAKAALNSRLASASTAALRTLAKALPTWVSPLVKAMPLARKPMSGITAMAAMRPRTEILVTSCRGERRCNSASGMVGLDPSIGNPAFIPSMRLAGRGSGNITR